MTNPFAERLLAWYDRHGRKELPWQQHGPLPRDPYPIWISEIMLQQTQVATVIPYFERFIARFPDVAALAEAHIDEVLAHWSGLGYYARGRNLQRAAQQIMQLHGGRFPTTIEAVEALPGVGRSTAGAILALAFAQRHPILDGNVKRVLCRHQAIEGWPGNTTVSKKLWALAENYTPQARVDAYTQAIMDLGATLCRRSRPACPACPLGDDCVAYQQGRQGEFPNSRPRKVVPLRHATLLLLQNAAGELLLERRPPSGIWGGLWSLPELAEGESVEAFCAAQGLTLLTDEEQPELLHTFSHFRLQIHPRLLRVEEVSAGRVMEPEARLWYKTESINQLGLPTPIRLIVDRLGQTAQE